MKKFCIAAALSAAFLAPSVSAEKLSFSIQPGTHSVDLAPLLPANFVASSAILTVFLPSPGFQTSAPELGSYLLQSEVQQGASCNGGNYLFCETVTQTFVREQTTNKTPLDISGLLTVGQQSVDGDSAWMSSYLLQKQAGASSADSTNHQSEDIVFGFSDDGNGNLQPIYIHRETISNYITQDYMLVYAKPELSMDLVFDTANLAALNAGRGFDYQLSGQYLFAPARAELMIQGDISPVPEPATAAFLLAGLPVLGWMARRRRAA